MNKTSFAAFGAAIVLAAAAICGCESADSYEITVKPGDATVTSASPSVALTASGWSDYQWSLSDTSLGYLSASKGASVVYTARSGTFLGGRQTVTVSAVGSGTSSTSTTNSAAGYTAQTIITHADETVVETEEEDFGTVETPKSASTTTPSSSSATASNTESTDPANPQ